MLLPYLIKDVTEAGCDEAGRGPLAGSVFAAAVILPPGFRNELLNDSKQLTARQRNELRTLIEHEAISWAVSEVTAEEIDRINILNASILAMHRALAKLSPQPQHIIVDGNRFKPYMPPLNAEESFAAVAIPHQTVVKGDGKYMSIAAASVLAKTHRDEYMLRLHEKHPQYGWEHNMGYPTKQHLEAIHQHGITPFHRKSFRGVRETLSPTSDSPTT